MLNIGLRLTSTGYSRKLLEENIRDATSGGVGAGGGGGGGGVGSSPLPLFEN